MTRVTRATPVAFSTAGLPSPCCSVSCRGERRPPGASGQAHGWRAMSLPDDPETALRTALAAILSRGGGGMTLRFAHGTLGQRVRFASEAAEQEVALLGAARVMVIPAPAEADLAQAVTADVPVVLVHDEVVMHVPVAVAVRARECGRPAPTRSMRPRGRGDPRPCTTRSATSWADAATCRTQRPTPSSCRTSWPSTRRPRRRQRLDAPRALRDYGFEESQVPDAVAATCRSRPGAIPSLTPDDLTRLLHSSSWRTVRRSSWQETSPSVPRASRAGSRAPSPGSTAPPSGRQDRGVGGGRGPLS